MALAFHSIKLKSNIHTWLPFNSTDLSGQKLKRKSLFQRVFLDQKELGTSIKSE